MRLTNRPTQTGNDPGDVFEQVLDSIENRLKRRIEGADATVYKSLADRIEKLREQAITNVEESLAFHEEALQIARDVVAADPAAEAGDSELYDPKTGSLTRIVEENTPPGLHKIIPDIAYAIDRMSLGSRTSADTRTAIATRPSAANCEQPRTTSAFRRPWPLLDKTYTYVRENY